VAAANVDNFEGKGVVSGEQWRKGCAWLWIWCISAEICAESQELFHVERCELKNGRMFQVYNRRRTLANGEICGEGSQNKSKNKGETIVGTEVGDSQVIVQKTGANLGHQAYFKPRSAIGVPRGTIRMASM
jgi:hypothetical protein